MLEGNSEMVMIALKEGENSLALIAPFIKDALLSSSPYDKLLYSHTRRDGNKFAHSLAKHSINVSNYIVWMEDVPPSLHSIFQADLAMSLSNKIVASLLSKKKKKSSHIRPNITSYAENQLIIININ